jgi:DNA-binding NarL/FixJ family response regulator
VTVPVQVGPSPAGGGPVPSQPLRCLTPRQLEVLRLAANGHSNRAIGRRLGTAEVTVKSQMAAILRRLHVEDRAQAVAVGLRLGILALDDVDIPGPMRRLTLGDA